MLNKKINVSTVFGRIRLNFLSKIRELQSIQDMVDYATSCKHDLH
jgi:hypothetical protein